MPASSSSEIDRVASYEDAGTSWVGQLFPSLRFLVNGAQEGEAGGVAPCPSTPSAPKGKHWLGQPPAETTAAVVTDKWTQQTGSNERGMQGDGNTSEQACDGASLDACTVDGNVKKMRNGRKVEKINKGAMPSAVSSVLGGDSGETVRPCKMRLVDDVFDIVKGCIPSTSKPTTREAARDVAAGALVAQHTAAVGDTGESNLGMNADSPEITQGGGYRDVGGGLWNVVERKKKRRHDLHGKGSKKKIMKTQHIHGGR